MKGRRIGPWIVGALVVLVIVAAIVAMLRKPAVPVDLGRVERGAMEVTIDDEAETRAHDVYVVSAPIGGRLLRVEVEPGDRVEAGQAIARLTPTEPQFVDARQEAELRARAAALDAMAASMAARIAEARSARDLATAEYQRNQAVYARGFLSKAALERAQSAKERAEAAVVAAQQAAASTRFDLAAARAALAQPSGAVRTADAVTVRAPASGWVLRVPQESESSVTPGARLIEIGDPNGLEIVSDLLSSDAVKVRPGARAWLDQWGGGKPIAARVRRIEPYGFTKISALGVEEQRVNVILDFTGPAEERARLGHGYRGIIRIVVWAKQDTLTVPASALFRDGADWALFVADAGRARLARVKVGAINPDRAELLGGLKPGAKVVVHPGDRVVDGVRITERAN